VDTEYKLTDEHYTIDDFIEDLKKKRIHKRRKGRNFWNWNYSQDGTCH
jgi:hypothetical protein